ncbi:hypothetical protein LSTR_LSTR001250 [Laodelphax striatellus]|uniref:Uncharacterized protein n=1 Tax=Laodelphax striatellus TaxID=195883 RepID=A0A482XBN4_LAOST|nr:hypothetical protein LSTR_LSTR017125 [Laodelphax striatellus]RZF43072.1 hypothetical protein LSTR_LSTR001250 [Laodelphax striatellus]
MTMSDCAWRASRNVRRVRGCGIAYRSEARRGIPYAFPRFAPECSNRVKGRSRCEIPTTFESSDPTYEIPNVILAPTIAGSHLSLSLSLVQIRVSRSYFIAGTAFYCINLHCEDHFVAAK